MFRSHGLAIGFVLSSVLSLLACGGHRDGFLDPSATSDRLCELDLHCPAGAYCSAGVCDSDCKADADCGAGESCDPRGRCLAAGAKARPPKYAGHLVAPPSTLALSVESPSGAFTLQNDGVEDIGRFHVVSDDPDVTASPASGPLPSGASVEVRVQVAPGFAGQGATLHILSTGGRADVWVAFGSTLSGRLVGSVDVSAPYALGAAPFALEISGSADAMTGSVDPKTSLLWPVNAPVAASDDGKTFTATFSFFAASGATGNPLFDVPVERSVTLDGQHVDPASVAGTYTETIQGPPGLPLTTSGTFTLRHVGAATGVTSAPQPIFAQGGFSTPPAACTCTDPSCPAGAAAQADWFFEQGFGFEVWSAAQSYQGSNRCVLSTGRVGSCTVPIDIGCAFGGYRAEGADDGLLDVWRAQATYGLLAGKTGLAEALQPIGTATGLTATLSAQERALATAVGLLEAGLHAHGSDGQGLLASGNFRVARAAVGSLPFGKASSRDTAELDDEQRFGGAVATWLFAAAVEADDQQRDGTTQLTSLLTDAQGAASGALLDLAAIGVLVGSPDGSIAGLQTGFAPLADTFEKVVKGLNAAGFEPGYVPFAYSPNAMPSDLYGQLLPQATATQAQVAADEAALIVENQAVANGTQSLQEQVSGIATAQATAITALCGTTPQGGTLAQGCGSQGGEIGVDLDDMNAAMVALQAAKDRHSAAVLKLGTLEQQAQEELADQVDQLNEIDADNNKIAVIDQAKAEEQEVNQAYQCLSGILFPGGASVGSAAGAGAAAGGGGMPFASCVPFVELLATGPVSQTEQEDAARADEQVTLMLGSQEITDDAMAIAVQQAQADKTGADEDVVEQTALFDAASQKLSGDRAQLQQAQDNAQQATALAEQSPATDPSFRLLQNAELVAWTRDMRQARKWCYLTARALAYTLDADVTAEGDCLAAGSAQDLAGALGEMSDTYHTEGLVSWDQVREDTLSMARDVFGMTKAKTDPVTGETLTIGQQFQALLALPTNRDAAGNLRLSFATSIGAGNAIFSSQVGTDVITSIAGNLIATSVSGVTAYLTLQQSGHGRLRSFVDGSLKDYTLDPKTALVPAGLNLSSSGDPKITVGTDLFGRSVEDSAWTLVLDEVDDPRNKDVVIADLTDIELWVTHRARTIQTP